MTHYRVSHPENLVNLGGAVAACPGPSVGTSRTGPDFDGRRCKGWLPAGWETWSRTLPGIGQWQRARVRLLPAL